MAKNNKLEGRAADGKVFISGVCMTPKQVDKHMEYVAGKIGRAYTNFMERAAYTSGKTKVKPKGFP